jgi:hypothetical protein
LARSGGSNPSNLPKKRAVSSSDEKDRKLRLPSSNE